MYSQSHHIPIHVKEYPVANYVAFLVANREGVLKLGVRKFKELFGEILWEEPGVCAQAQSPIILQR